VGVLVEAERTELVTALKDSGLQLGDRVKVRLWMDRKMSSKGAGPFPELAGEQRAQVETTASASPSISDDASRYGCGGAPDLPYPAGRGLSVETIAIMVTVLLDPDKARLLR
jgi:hypothetical protein